MATCRRQLNLALVAGVAIAAGGLHVPSPTGQFHLEKRKPLWRLGGLVRRAALKADLRRRIRVAPILGFVWLLRHHVPILDVNVPTVFYHCLL